MSKILLGFMGAGKTTIANLLDSNFLDMDTIIEKKVGMTISDLFEKEGEAAFRQLERETLEELIKLEGDEIISTGGGVVTSEHNRELLRANKDNNILLAASFEVLYRRIQNDKIYQRPLFLNNSKEDFRAIFEKRMAMYDGLAGLVINVDDKTPEEIAEIIRCM